MARLDKRQNFRLESETKLLIKRLTKEEGLSQSEIIRQALEVYETRSENETLGQILGDKVLGFEQYRKLLEVQLLEIERQSKIVLELAKQLVEASYGDKAKQYISQAEEVAIESLDLPRSRYEAIAKRDI